MGARNGVFKLAVGSLICVAAFVADAQLTIYNQNFAGVRE